MGVNLHLSDEDEPDDIEEDADGGQEDRPPTGAAESGRELVDEAADQRLQHAELSQWEYYEYLFSILIQ